jgi:hypothetical protein
MIFYRIACALVSISIAWFIVSEIFLPAVRKRPFFPSLRSNESMKKALSKLAEVENQFETAHVELEAAKVRASVLDLEAEVKRTDPEKPQEGTEE